MNRKTINLFMWGYQHNYRIDVEHRMDKVLEELGIHEQCAECLLVGAQIPGTSQINGVCLEPEDGKWPLNLFNELLISIEAEIEAHPLRNIIYTDEPSMRDKPENIRRDSVRRAVQKSMVRYDKENSILSFAGPPAPVGDYYVVPIIQLPLHLFQRFRPLQEPITDGNFTGEPSLIHAAIKEVLREAYDELLRPDPGRYLMGRSRSAGEIIRRAAKSFMYTLSLAIGKIDYENLDLFENFNHISSLMYEGAEGTGKLLLANPANEDIDILLEFVKPVPFRENRWSRKILQMASAETALLSDCNNIIGLGNLTNGIKLWETQNIFEVEFLDHYHWQLSCGENILLVSRYGVPCLPQERFPLARLIDTYRRLFHYATDEDMDNFICIFETAISQHHGSMLVVAEDAEVEAERLQRQGTRVKAAKLTPELYRQVSEIDGTIIIDPHCVCHAIGVILDGTARQECTPSRGSRYNSGVRYVGASDTSRLAVVISDDRTVDVMPILLPRIKKSEVEANIAQLEASNHDNYNLNINWLDRHRFYLDQDECNRVNIALKRIEGEPIELGELRIQWPEFTSNPELSTDYFEPED